MKMKKSHLTALSCVIGLFILIVDTKTAVEGATAGIDLCLRTVIPSLFPFIFLTTILLPTIGRIGLLHPVGRLCGVPTGLESILLIGFLGGYPIGAQVITASWKKKRIATIDARRMLGFCSNAGPSFLFGMGTTLFNSTGYIWMIWFVHILSAIFVGMLLPNKRNSSGSVQTQEPVTSIAALKISIQAMSKICGWVILFKVLLTFLNSWILCLCPDIIRALATGFIELSNGILICKQIDSVGLRMIIIATIIGFGGICVLLQTQSVADNLGIGYYFPGKVLQSLISFLLAYILQLIVLPSQHKIILPISYIIGACLSIILVLFCLYRKKTVAITMEMRYNTRNKSKEKKIHVIS